MSARRSRDTYVDCDGRPWPVGKLDAMLADPDTKNTVMSGVGIGLKPSGTWSPGAVLAWASCRYHRPEPAALLLLLVTRYFDTEGARFRRARGSL